MLLSCWNSWGFCYSEGRTTFFCCVICSACVAYVYCGFCNWMFSETTLDWFLLGCGQLFAFVENWVGYWLPELKFLLGLQPVSGAKARNDCCWITGFDLPLLYLAICSFWVSWQAWFGVWNMNLFSVTGFENKCSVMLNLGMFEAQYFDLAVILSLGMLRLVIGGKRFIKWFSFASLLSRVIGLCGDCRVASLYGY